MEIYEENLLALMSIMDHMDDLAGIEGVFEVEVRVRLDDLDEWAVIGYGEAGDPCVLRFEKDKTVVPIIPLPGSGWKTGGIVSIQQDKALRTTNKTNTPLGVSDYNVSGDFT